MRNHPQVKSSVAIAKLLASEGYSEKLAGKVRQYAKRQFSSQAERKYVRVCKSMSNACKKLSEGDKLVIGRFVAWQSRISLDAGLRIGLAASLTVEETGKRLSHPTGCT